MGNFAGLPPIYADKPIELAPAKVIASFPVNTFLENLAIALDGMLVAIRRACFRLQMA